MAFQGVLQDRAWRNWLLVLLAGMLVLGLIAAFGRAPASAAERSQQLYVGPAGSDRHDGTSAERPLRTIGEALERALPGTTINLQPGTYYEQVVTRRAGSAGAPIVIRSVGATAVIDGSRLRGVPGRDQNWGLVELRHPFFRLAGIRVARSPNTAILLAADDVSVENCHIVDAQLHGVSSHTDRQTNYRGRPGTMIRRVKILSNLVERAPLAREGQAISLIADGFEIRGNTVRNSPREGIDIWLGARNGQVVGNIVHGNQAAGIYVDGASAVRIHRNRVFRNGSGIGISSEDENYRTQAIIVDNNIVHDNEDAGIFLWDQGRRTGFNGVQNVSVLHNTLIGNRYAFYLSGRSNSARIVNNLAWSRRSNISNNASGSSFVIDGNVWLREPRGFVSASNKNFRLLAGSAAIDRGVPLKGRAATKQQFLGADFDNNKRPTGRAPDAGAFEYSGDR